jgi:hypothetical protein
MQTPTRREGASCGGFDEMTGTMGAACAAGLTCITDPNMVCMGGSCPGVCTSPTATSGTCGNFDMSSPTADRSLMMRCSRMLCSNPGANTQAECETSTCCSWKGATISDAIDPVASVSNPQCWSGAYTESRCCAGRGDSTCWSGRYTYNFCCTTDGH